MKFIKIVIIIFKNESAVHVWERVRTIYESEDANPTQPKHGRKNLGNSRRQKERSD